MKRTRSPLSLSLGFSALTALAPAAGIAGVSDLAGDIPPAGAVWLETLDLSNMATGFGRGTAATTVTGNPISIGGVAFAHGIGTHANSELTVELAGGALRFLAAVGVDDDLKCLAAIKAPEMAAVEFTVWVDGKRAATSRTVRFGQAPALLDVDLKGARTMRLVVEKKPGARFNHVTWGGAALIMGPGAPRPATLAPKNPKITLPSPAAAFTPLSAREDAQVRSEKGDASVLWLDAMDLSKARTNPKPMSARTTLDGHPLRLGAVVYPHGIASGSESELRIDLGGTARRFVARTGLDSNLGCGKVNSGGSAVFEVWVDGRPLVQTGARHGYDRPFDISIDLTGAKLLVINSSADGASAVWAGAHLQLDPAAKGTRPRTVAAPPPEPAVIARRNLDEVRLNGARVAGTTPGRPFLFLIPATGKAPLRFAATGLPAGLTLDANTGVISGMVKQAGTTSVTLKVIAANGEAQRTLTIVAAKDSLARTPPMGWNSWNVWGLDVDDAKVRAAADAFVNTGLAAQGFQYINIDDGWEDGRDAKGNIKTNKKFPDMTALSAYVHDKGLRLGIYSSPGPQTCGGFEGSYKHEAQDARTWASWGIDYLKHDWCSYGSVAKGNTLADLQRPYVVMQKALRASGRDIVYSLCQYGMGEVWNWGAKVGGNLWRTTGDIVDTWASLSDIGFSQAGKESGAGPGGWNDPDMLIVGKVGWSANIRNTRLSPNEQVLHLTLWAMLAAPLLLGNDLAQIDSFTLDLLLNPEVIDVDQDPLGRQATRKATDGPIEVWSRPLHDGTTAVALFNRGQLTADGTAKWADLGLTGDQPVRNLWLRKDVGRYKDSLKARVPSHGAVFLRIGTPKP